MTGRARTLVVLLLALAAGWGSGGARAAAQGEVTWGSNVVASVTVAPPPILLETTRHLYFGSVGAGQTVSVPAQPPYAPGTWSAAVRFGNLMKQPLWGVSLTLPTELVNGSGATLPVTWNDSEYGWICVWNAQSGNPSACGVMEFAFNPANHTSPASPVTVNIPNSSPGNNQFVIDVYLGGELTVPGGGVPPGLYSAPVQITLARVN